MADTASPSNWAEYILSDRQALATLFVAVVKATGRGETQPDAHTRNELRRLAGRCRGSLELLRLNGVGTAKTLASMDRACGSILRATKRKPPHPRIFDDDPAPLAELSSAMASLMEALNTLEAGKAPPKGRRYNPARLGAALRTARDAANKTQDELAGALGVNGGANLVSRWERGRRTPSAQNLGFVEDFIREHHPGGQAALDAAWAD